MTMKQCLHEIMYLISGQYLPFGQEEQYCWNPSEKVPGRQKWLDTEEATFGQACPGGQNVQFTAPASLNEPTTSFNDNESNMYQRSDI